MGDKLDRLSYSITNWIGTPASVIVHTALFAAAFSFLYFGFTLGDVLLVLTTIVSLEAIYLAIFIQMTVNRHSEHLEEVSEEIEGIQENVEDLGEDVQEISEDIDSIRKEDEEDNTAEAHLHTALAAIQGNLEKLAVEINDLKRRVPHPTVNHPPAQPFVEQRAGPVQRLMSIFTPKHKSSDESKSDEAESAAA